MTPAPDPPDEPSAPAPADVPPDPGSTPGSAPREVVLPRGCNPLTFGVVMATLEMGLILWLMSRCS